MKETDYSRITSTGKKVSNRAKHGTQKSGFYISDAGRENKSE